MFERLDDQARLAVERAFEEARAFRHDQVGTEHLLLGLLSVGRGHAADALVSCGATLEGCRAKVVEAAASKRRPPSGPELTLTDRAARSLERAARLSLRERSAYVSPDHVLLSVLDVEGTAGQVLRGLFVDLARLRAAVQAGADGSGTEARVGKASAAKASSAKDAGAVVSQGKVASRLHGPGTTVRPTAVGSPRCASCDLDLEATLAHKAVLSRGDDGVMVRWLVAYCSSCGTALGGYRLAD